MFLGFLQDLQRYAITIPQITVHVTTCFSYSLPDLNLLVTNFILCIHVK